MNMIRFFVPGEPQPQGSHRGFYVAKLKRVVITDDCPKTRPWRSDVRDGAMVAMGSAPIMTGPIALTIQFLFPRPAGQMGTGKNADKVKASAPAHPAVRPDIDKLARSVCDALKGLAWGDDSQVCALYARKDYVGPGVRPGAIIQVEPLISDVAPHS